MGRHEWVIDQKMWDAVHAALRSNGGDNGAISLRGRQSPQRSVVQDAAVAHAGDAAGVGRGLGVVGDHQDGLAEALDPITQARRAAVD